MFKDIPVEVGVIFEGERIRRNDMQVELGGPTVKQKFELAKVKPMNEVEDGKITIIGPDLKDMVSWRIPIQVLVEGRRKTRSGLEGVIERRIHGYLNYIEGFMHLNQR
jgi:acetyl-CoA decarbonylase/synthase complex subunit beta